MKHYSRIFALLLTLSNITAQETIIALELDTAWEKLKKSISKGDFRSFKSVYHRDAILVNGISKKTIHKAFQKAIRIRKNKKKTLKSPFGDGNASLKIVKKLENLSLDKDLIQKELMY